MKIDSLFELLVIQQVLHYPLTQRSLPFQFITLPLGVWLGLRRSFRAVFACYNMLFIIADRSCKLQKTAAQAKPCEEWVPLLFAFVTANYAKFGGMKKCDYKMLIARMRNLLNLFCCMSDQYAYHNTNFRNSGRWRFGNAQTCPVYQHRFNGFPLTLILACIA